MTIDLTNEEDTFRTLLRLSVVTVYWFAFNRLEQYTTVFTRKDPEQIILRRIRSTSRSSCPSRQGQKFMRTNFKPHVATLESESKLLDDHFWRQALARASRRASSRSDIRKKLLLAEFREIFFSRMGLGNGAGG